jgi:hypothetical protein
MGRDAHQAAKQGQKGGSAKDTRIEEMGEQGRVRVPDTGGFQKRP